VETAVLPLVAVIVCFVAARGGFERMTDGPRAFAGLLSALALLSMAWKPKVGTRPRMALISQSPSCFRSARSFSTAITWKASTALTRSRRAPCS